MQKDSKLVKQYQQQIMMTANFDSFYILLIVVPEDLASYETMNILKFHQFPFNIEEDNVLKQVVKLEMGF